MTGNMDASTIIAPLLSATTHKKVNWEEDPSGGYIVKYDRSAINIYAMDDHDGPPTLALRVLDSKKRVVDFVFYESGTDEFEKLESIFEMARRQVLKADEVISNALENLLSA